MGRYNALLCVFRMKNGKTQQAHTSENKKLSISYA